MDFKSFLNNVIDVLPDYLFSYDVDSIRVQTVTKNNGVKLTGLVIMIKDEDIAPNIYMEYYYNQYRQGKSMDEIAVMLVEEYEQIRNKIPEYSIGSFDIMKMRESVYMVLVNFEKNKDKLEYCPYIKFLDLAIMFRYVARIDDDSVSSGIVRNVEQSLWKLGTDELYTLAKKNMEKQFPISFSRLSDKLRDMKPDIDFIPETNMYILSNTKNSYGAIYMTDKDFLEEFARNCGSGFYILPSSVHEVLLMPESPYISENQMREVIQEVNQYVLSEFDFLSDNLYYYNREKKIIEY